MFKYIAAVLIAAAAAKAQDCNLLNVNLTVQSNPASSLPGQSVTTTAYVEPTGNGPDPSGTLQFFDGDTDLGTHAVVLGQASVQTTYTTAGAHSIYVFYSGDTNYCPALARYGQQVNRFVTTIAASASPTAVVTGQPVTFTVQLGPVPPSGVSPPSGSVEFFEGSRDLGGVAIATGNPTFTLNSLTAGNHQITAVYNGDTNYYLVRSSPIAITVSLAPTRTVLAQASNGSRVTLTVVIDVPPPGSGSPTGSIQFVDSTTKTVLATTTLPAASLIVTPALIAASAGHSLTAIYSGDANFAGSTSNVLVIPALLSATGATSATFAADELVSLFGVGLVDATMQGTTIPLPTTLGKYGVTVTDSAGSARAAGLYLISPGQINLVIPAGTAPGSALVNVSGSTAIPIQVTIGSVAPGLFSADATGKGLAAAQIVRVHSDGSQTLENVSSTPIVFGGDTLYLVLYATGVRSRSSLANVAVRTGNPSLAPTYAGPQGQFPGLDQVDVALPASLQGAGQVNISLTVDGQASNVVTLTFQ